MSIRANLVSRFVPIDDRKKVFICFKELNDLCRTVGNGQCSNNTEQRSNVGKYSVGMSKGMT